MVPLGVRSNGQAYCDAIESELKKDNLWEFLSAHLTSVTTDSAPNMVSKDVGFTKLLTDRLNRKSAFPHKCMAHRLELILDAALRAKVFTNAKKLDRQLKTIYSFIRNSPKRLASLNKYCDNNRKRRFKPRRVLDVRWVSTHFGSGAVVFENWETLIGFLVHLQTDPDYAENTKSNKATYLPQNQS